MENCIFCKIVEGKMPCYKIYEDNHSIGFLDISPRTDGHTLVLLKSHYDTLQEVPHEEFGHLFKALQEISALLRTSLNVPALNIHINNGKEAGQEIPHLHIHVVPRKENDNGFFILQGTSPTKKLEDVQKLILQSD